MTRDNPRRAKKILVVAAALVLIGTVLGALLIYSAFNALTHAAASAPDLDLAALKELTTSKDIVLTAQQRAAVLLLAKKLEQDTLTPAESADLRTQLLGLLEPSQMKQIEVWKEQTMKQASEFAATPQQIIAAVERSTGLSKGSVKNWLDGVLAWWKIKKPGDNTQGLAEALAQDK